MAFFPPESTQDSDRCDSDRLNIKLTFLHTGILSLQKSVRAGEMIQWIMSLPLKPDDLSIYLDLLVKENQLLKVVLSPPHPHCDMTCLHSYTQNNND